MFPLRQEDEIKSSSSKWLTIGEEYLSPAEDVHLNNFINYNDDDLKRYFNGYNASRRKFSPNFFTSFVNALGIPELSAPKKETADQVGNGNFSIKLPEADNIDEQQEAALEELLLDMRTIVVDLIGKAIHDVDKIQLLDAELNDLRDPHFLIGIDITNNINHDICNVRFKFNLFFFLSVFVYLVFTCQVEVLQYLIKTKRWRILNCACLI